MGGFGWEISMRISGTSWNTFSSQFSRQKHLAVNAEIHHTAGHYQLVHALLSQETPQSGGSLCKKGHMGTGTYTCLLVPPATPRPWAPKARCALPLSEDTCWHFSLKLSQVFQISADCCHRWLLIALSCILNSCPLPFMGLFWIVGGLRCNLSPRTHSPPGFQAGKSSDFRPLFLAGTQLRTGCS